MGPGVAEIDGDGLEGPEDRLDGVPDGGRLTVGDDPTAAVRLEENSEATNPDRHPSTTRVTITSPAMTCP
jgi:hypothetical protein